MPEPTASDQLEGQTCPRCGAVARQRFYGPCAACREQLVATLLRQPVTGEAPSLYVPRDHVVANHVATKD